MKFKNLTPILALIILAATSCKKEKSEAPSPIAGNWKLVSIGGNSSVTSSYTFGSDNIKTETFTTFASSNPKGQYKITSNAFNAEGIGYDYTGSVTVKDYENDVLQSEDTAPINSTIPPTNGTSTYKLIGSDSIYFENNALGTSTSAPGGCKYKLEGTQLSLYINSSSTATASQGGFTVTNKTGAVVTVVLQKQ
jgi:hypothetical protein